MRSRIKIDSISCGFGGQCDSAIDIDGDSCPHCEKWNGTNLVAKLKTKERRKMRIKWDHFGIADFVAISAIAGLIAVIAIMLIHA